MKKKLIAITLTTLITIGAFTGCGNTAGNTANSNTTGTTNHAANNTSATAVDNTAVINGKQSKDNSGADTGNQNTGNSVADTTDIGSDTASQIALEAAGFTEADVTGLLVKSDYDDGRMVYEIEFWYDNTEYDYEILASNGEILSSGQDVSDNRQGHHDTQNNQTGQGNTQISLEDAKKLALDRVPGATEQNMKIELDYDDGYYKYEGEIIYDQKEYEFEIDANTGTFLEWSEERW